MRFSAKLIIGLSLAVSQLPLVHSDEGNWIAVFANEHRAAVEKLARHRQAQGFRVTLIEAEPVTSVQGATQPDKLLKRVRDSWTGIEGRTYLLLVGAPSYEPTEVPRGLNVVPAHAGTAGRMKSQLTDNAYGCVAGDVLAKVAVGRFPAQTLAEAEAMVQRTIAWESLREPGTWKRRLVLLAGAPSFNRIVDSMIEGLAFRGFDRLSPVWTGNVIYHNPNSCFTLPDEDLVKRAEAYLVSGQQLTLYLGHSNADGFWHVPAADGFGTNWKPLFQIDHWRRIKLPAARGIFATFGCYGAQYSGHGGEGYAVAAMRNQGGPVAAIGSHGACYAAMAMLMSDGMLDALPATAEGKRLGDIWMKMRRHLAEGKLEPLVFHALDAVDGDPKTPEAEQRQEHQEMFLLLGDPATTLSAFAHQVEFNVECHRAGTWIVSGTVPGALSGGDAVITLERTLASQSGRIQSVPKSAAAADRDRLWRANHECANQFELLRKQTRLNGRSLSVQLDAPSFLPGDEIVVRVVVTKDAADGSGAKRITVDEE